MRHAHFVILALILTSALLGCRTVWLHEDWEQGLFEKDYSECRALAAEGRNVTKVTTRKCTVNADAGEEICIEEQTSKRGAPRMNWKMCMSARGWEHTTGARSEARSRPKDGSMPASHRQIR